MSKILYLLLCALFTVACATEITGGANDDGNNAGAIASLLAVDREFAAMSRRDGPAAAFAAFADPDVRTFPNNETATKGIEELIEETSFWPANLQIDWEPEEAFASAEGDFGYTWGYATFTRINNGQPPKINHGKYVTIWRKNDDGEWRWIADLGNSAPPPSERQ